MVAGLLGVLLVGADHAARPALDPTDDVLARDLLAVGAEYPAALVADHAAVVVEGKALERAAPVADRAEHEAALELLALAGIDGADAPRLVLLKLIAADHDLLDLAVALYLDGRAQEAQHDAAALALGLALGELGEDVDVLARCHVGLVGLDVGAA